MTPQDRFNQFMALVDSGCNTKAIACQLRVPTTYVSGMKVILDLPRRATPQDKVSQ